MLSQKKLKYASLLLLIILFSVGLSLYAQTNESQTSSLARNAIAKELGWIQNNQNYCGGYYLEEAFIPDHTRPAHSVKVTGDEGLLSPKRTSILEGKVTLTRRDQQMTANKAYVYRDPITQKLSAVEMIGDVHLREQNTLVISKKGRYTVETEAKSLMDIIYRTTLLPKTDLLPVPPTEHHVLGLTAWGHAEEFAQNKPNVYELNEATFSTCPPRNPAWQIKANSILLDKNTGRGSAKGAQLFVKSVPVLYLPYFSFSIDKQRKSGFLWPRPGTKNQWGPYLLTPFYWDMAPNYDMTLMPAYLAKRGFMISDNFRYITALRAGTLNLSIVPNDRAFKAFQRSSSVDEQYTQSSNPVVQAELNRLLNASPTRIGFFLRDDARYNEHWSSHIDFNYASDDYYLRNFGSNLNEIMQNQLLQEGDIFYKSEHWNFTGRLQAYQTLHPINNSPVLNSYRRVPQLVLNGNYPNQLFGLEYFINTEITNFSFIKTPGTDTVSPVGQRLHMQPGISLPYYMPYFFINPRLQLALTQYSLKQTEGTVPNDIHRVIPIFDLSTGLSFNREATFLNFAFRQTLEPQIYYTYIPYHKQSNIPTFDTSVNTLVYDQIFNYNRFSGIDRIGDANQLGLGLTTRLIDQLTGVEKVRFGIGEIVYFAKRRVTLCNDDTCTDNPSNASNDWRLSPLSSVLNYAINWNWNASANVLWNPISKQLNNATLGLHYQTDNNHIINLGYTYAFNGDVLSGVVTPGSQNNLKVTDFSFSWPAPFLNNLTMLGLWSQDFNRRHLQNLFYGIQYDTCCWAVRMVASRAFLGINPNKNNTTKYSNDFYIQFSLKGIGNIGDNAPRLSTISGYNPQFGQDI
ncbi:MAG: LPS-assembly protein LptD [Gammaproteobacteria bacterium]|nr:LPS-assembly protein LptD [Gammaproteobacteria bacterium]